MSKKSVDLARKEIEQILFEREAAEDFNELSLTLHNTLETTDTLKDWEKDFAFRSTLEYRSQIHWATYYNKGRKQIQKTLAKESFKQLVAQLNMNLRTYTLKMREYLVREALMQYSSIFHMRETQFNVETKRKAAKELIEMFGFGVVGKSESEDIDNKSTGSVVSFDLSVDEQDHAENLKVNVDDLKAEVSRLEQLNTLNAQVHRYQDTTAADADVHNTMSDSDVRRTTKGFHKQAPKKIKVD